MLAMNVDALRLSTHLYKTREGKLGMGPLWDFDRALDSADGRDDNPANLARQRGRDRLSQLRLVGPPLQGHQLLAEVHRPMVRAARARSARRASMRRSTRWPTRFARPRSAITQKWPGQGPRFGGFQGEIDHLKQWLETRCTWVDGQFVAPPQIVPDGGHVPAGP